MSRSPPATEALRALPAVRIVRAVADAAARWTDADFPPRVRATAAIRARTGYAEPVVAVALDRLFGGITAVALERTIAGELGSLAALDGFVARAGRPSLFARGVDRVAVVASATTIGVAIAPLVFALCAKCAVLVKDRSDALVAAFAATLAEEEPALGAAIETGVWDGTTAGAARLAGADVVVAFGGTAALRAIRDALAPETTFVAYGRRIGAAYVPAEYLADAADLAGAAADALLYDGEGCLSLRLCFVEARGAAFEAFVRRFGAALDAASIAFPRGDGPLDPRFVALRERLRFRAAAEGRMPTIPPEVGHLVVPLARDEPPPLLPRAIGVLAVASPTEARAYGDRMRLPLEALGFAGPAPSAALSAAFADGSVARLCRVGNLQDPPITGEHGAIGRISHFVRRVNLTA